MQRKDFLLSASAITASAIAPGYGKNVTTSLNDLPIEEFRQANFGLFIHYGLYSLLARDAWPQFREKIHVAEYEKLKHQFTADKFDADFITDLALDAGMKYLNLTTMHHDGFCLFETKETDFNSTQSAAKRDLLAEVAEQCRKKGLKLCLYYSHGRHWRHPHAMMNDKYGQIARPHFEIPEQAYARGTEHKIEKYVDYCSAQVRELLTNYGPIANMWFDGWATPLSGPWQEELKIPELYAMIRKLQPNCLISYKLGVTGTEDFFAPEFHWPKKEKEKFEAAKETGKLIEMNDHIAGWGYRRVMDGRHRDERSILKSKEYADSIGANYLLNTGPRSDGSIDEQDIASLRAVGKALG